MQMEQGWMVDVMMKRELCKVIWRLATTQWVVDAIMGRLIWITWERGRRRQCQRDQHGIQ